MDRFRCKHEGCAEPVRYLLSDANTLDTFMFCEGHFTVLCAAYLFSATTRELPDEKRLVATYNGLALTQEEVDCG